MNECWLYSMVDIKNQNSMSMCVVGNKSLDSLYCNIITCTCNKKVKRNIESTVYENNNSGGNKTHLKTASCEITTDEQFYWPYPFSKQHTVTINEGKSKIFSIIHQWKIFKKFHVTLRTCIHQYGEFRIRFIFHVN